MHKLSVSASLWLWYQTNFTKSMRPAIQRDDPTLSSPWYKS